MKPSLTIASQQQTRSIACTWTLDSRIQNLSLTFTVEARDTIDSTVTACLNNTSQTSHCEGLTPGTRYLVSVTVGFGEHTDSETMAGSTGTPVNPILPEFYYGSVHIIYQISPFLL